MKRMIFTGSVVAATLFVPLCFVVNVNALRKDPSSTNRVVIDGRSFVSDGSTSDDSSLLKREFGKLGARLPVELNLAEESPPSHPLFSGRLKDSPREQPIDRPILPAGFFPEHTLSMEGGGRPVDLVSGKLAGPGSSIRSRLLSSGWNSAISEKYSGRTHVLQITQGKETSIVCLDEEEGTFLLLREVGR